MKIPCKLGKFALKIDCEYYSTAQQSLKNLDHSLKRVTLSDPLLVTLIFY